MIHAPGLTAPAVLEKLATIPMVEVSIPTLDPRWLILHRHAQREKDVQAVLVGFASTFLLYHHNPASKAAAIPRPLSPQLSADPILW